jgi:hypothetical protein
VRQTALFRHISSGPAIHTWLDLTKELNQTQFLAYWDSFLHLFQVLEFQHVFCARHADPLNVQKGAQFLESVGTRARVSVIPLR